ncbi:MAG: hypothetical protein COB04_07130 [Gammaproteobacteria bacterium]|nr:MAG: hypothetical protein COB04_07130 [Gammaproteobacteria bacterium]
MNYFQPAVKLFSLTLPRFLSFGLMLLFLVSCASNSPDASVANVPLPDWVLSPPQDNGLYYYGIGQGRSIEQSKISALKDVSSKISVTVSGSSSTSSTLLNEKFRQWASVNTKSVVDAIKITDFDLVKNIQVQAGYYSLVKVSKEIIFNDVMLALQSLDQQMSDKVLRIESLSLLEQYAAWREIEGLIPAATSKAFILKSVDGDFNVSSYSQKYNTYLSRSESVLKSLNIYVTSDRKFNDIARGIVSALSHYGIKSSHQKTSSTNSKIIVSGTERNAFVFDSYIVNMTLNFDLLDKQEKIIKAQPVSLSGSSSIDYKSARIAASRNLVSEIDKTGVISFLGLRDIHLK